MMPGYIACLLLLAGCILLATGWKPYVAPGLSNVSICVIAALTLILYVLPAWKLPVQGIVYVMVACLLSLIWGCLHSLYSYEPFLAWLKPGWDIPVLCGLLVSLLISDVRRQPGLLIWCSVLGEGFAAWLDQGSYYAVMGSARWWDIVLLSYAVAICGNGAQALAKAGGLRLSRIFARLGPKGG